RQATPPWWSTSRATRGAAPSATSACHPRRKSTLRTGRRRGKSLPKETPMIAAPGLTVILYSSDDRLLLRCAGEIGISNVHLLRKPLDEYLTDSISKLTVDLCEVFYLDSSAIKELLRAAV